LGISRAVTQVHALTFLLPGLLPADEIAETLAVPRTNVSLMDYLSEEIYMGACSVKNI
jgi:DNA-binding transcriptional regulator GbsR (MarR family)